MTDYKPKEWQDLEKLYRQQNVRINELEQENKRLEYENDNLRCRVEDLEPNYDNRYNLINREREDHQKVVNRLLVNNFILILSVVGNLIVLLLK
jgi:molecular chaperone GrpE (heat shock protein)